MMRSSSEQTFSDLEGKHFIVTGGSAGLGRTIIEKLLQTGSKVYFCGRDYKKLLKVQKELDEKFNINQAFGFHCDVTNSEEVKQFLSKIEHITETIHGVVLNAGDNGQLKTFHKQKKSEWLSNFEGNILGSINFLFEVIPKFIKQRHGVVVQLSGGGATNPQLAMSSYSCAKIALVRLMEILALEYKEINLRFNCVAPGIMKTKLLDKLIQAGEENLGEEHFKKLFEKYSSSTDSKDIAASLILFLLSEESQQINGKIISAEWDDWQNFANHLDTIADSDIFTLRRKV